jgi:hypothetical protein
MNSNGGLTMSELESNVKSAVDAASEVVADAAKLGAAWVRYGLAVGESSLHTSARSLEDAASIMRKLADRLPNA